MLWFLHFHCIKNATHLHFVARFALQRTVQWPSRLSHTHTHTGGVGTTVKHILHKQREIVTGRRVARCCDAVAQAEADADARPATNEWEEEKEEEESHPLFYC